jgi:transcriptional regulator of aromatic amino acid metabolism
MKERAASSSLLSILTDSLDSVNVYIKIDMANPASAASILVAKASEITDI